MPNRASLRQEVSSPGLTFHRLREDELQVAFGPMFRVLYQLVDPVSPV